MSASTVTTTLAREASECRPTLVNASLSVANSCSTSLSESAASMGPSMGALTSNPTTGVSSSMRARIDALGPRERDLGPKVPTSPGGARELPKTHFHVRTSTVQRRDLWPCLQ